MLTYPVVLLYMAIHTKVFTLKDYFFNVLYNWKKILERTKDVR